MVSPMKVIVHSNYLLIDSNELSIIDRPVDAVDLLPIVSIILDIGSAR